MVSSNGTSLLSLLTTISSSGAMLPVNIPVAGLGSVPSKVVKRIVNKEYVDMWELLPDLWQVEAESSCCHTKRLHRTMLTDISIWTECFATMAAILVASHFFLYLHTITKARRTFECSAWASYDIAFHRQAADCGSLDWEMVDAPLYNEAFAGKAMLIPRCRYCLSDTHSSQECVHSPVKTSQLERTPCAKNVLRGLDACRPMKYASSSMPPGAPGADSRTAATYTTVRDASALTQLLSVVRAVTSPAPRHLAARYRASVALQACCPLRPSEWEPTPHLSEPSRSV